MPLTSTDRFVTAGRIFFAVSLIAFGLEHVIYGNFVTRVVLTWPAWIPGRAMWVYLVGVALMAAGLVIVLKKQEGRSVALILGGLMLLAFAFLSLPLAVKDIWWGGLWTSAGKALVIAGGAFAMVDALRVETGRGAHSASRSASPLLAALERFVPIARFCLGAFMVLAGIQHFIWAQGVQRLVPAWIPPGQLFWTYFAGVALIAGGLGLAVRKTAPLAAMLSGLMIFSWVFLVHIPLALVDLRNPNDVTAVFEALGFSGIAFVLAGTLPRKPSPAH